MTAASLPPSAELATEFQLVTGALFEVQSFLNQLK